jgi:hypothetical protein
MTLHEEVFPLTSYPFANLLPATSAGNPFAESEGGTGKESCT